MPTKSSIDPTCTTSIGVCRRGLSGKKMKRVQKAISVIFKAMNYGGGQGSGENDKSLQTDNNNGESLSRSSSRRPPSAPSQRQPPVIRIRREPSLNGVMWGSPQQLTSDSTNTTYDLGTPTIPTTHRSRKRQKQQKDKQQQQPEEETFSQKLIQPTQSMNNNMGNHIDSGNHLKVDERSRHHRSHSNDSRKGGKGGSGSNENLEYSPEAERFMRAAIDKSRPVERQVIRIINGNDPTVQSQVLLNTKTSQPWDDLVKDLGMAVKLPKKSDCQMETISGRRIQSYSQLRSEIQAGYQAFYVYSGRDDIIELGFPSLGQKRRVSQPQTTQTRRPDNFNLTYSDTSLPTIQHHNNHNLNVRNHNQTPQKSTKSTSMIIPRNDYLSSTENIPTLNRKSSMKASSSNNLTTKAMSSTAITQNNNRLSTGNLNTNYLSPSINVKDTLESSKSNPNLNSQQQQSHHHLGQKLQLPRNRSTRRRRSEASVYLASASRSRSVSP